MNNTDRNMEHFWAIMGFASWLSALVVALVTLFLLLTSCRWVPGADQHEHDHLSGTNYKADTNAPSPPNSPTK